jgi:hypothetical protein
MRRLTYILPLAGILALAIATPVGAKDFGTIYAEGEAYRTFANPARVDPGTGTDPIIAFTNFDQGGVAQYPPGQGSHGGRWQVWMATWVNPEEAFLLTDFDDIIALTEGDDPQITLERVEEADFRCPILPNG